MASEKTYRPTTLDELSGQEKAKKMLKVYISAAKMRGECLDHTLISGPSGCGKTTIANIIAYETGQSLKVYAGPAIKKVDDIVEILLGAEENSIVYIDEVHSLNRKIQEILFLAMEQYVLEATFDGATQRVDLPHFTLLASTTDLGGLHEAMRNRFHINVNLVQYTGADMTGIVMRSCAAQGIEIPEACAAIIAGCSRGVPRIANGYIRRINDFALVTNDGEITEEVVYEAFDFMDINKYGLNLTDMRYLQFLCEVHKAVGVDTIATYLGTDKMSLEKVTEPFLISQQYICKGPRGRFITEKGRKIIKNNLDKI